MLERPKSLVENSAEWLREGIREGRWAGGIPGLAPLAEECGIAENTLRRAVRILEQEGLLAHSGTGRRRQVAAAPGTVQRSRKLRVAVLLRDRLENESAGFRWAMARVQTELEALGHRLIQPGKSQADLHYNDARAMRLAAKTAADLWIVVAGQAPLLEWFAARPAPVFAFGGAYLKVPAIAATGSDPRPAHAETIRRLCELGHRRIVFLLPHYIRKTPNGSNISWLRNELAKYGIEAGAFHLPDWEETPAGLQRQLGAMFKVTPPTAIFATIPIWIAGILSFLARAGLKVPEDVSVICGDHASSFLWNQPPIAHYQHDGTWLARRIVRWVDNQAHGREDCKTEIKSARLVEGGSIGPAAGC